MYSVRVRIIRFVDEKQPGWVECELIDAFQCIHSFRDKVPIFSNNMLDANSHYPQTGYIACEIVGRWQEDGDELVNISTIRPDGIESINAQSQFVVLSNQVVGEQLINKS